jgi:hypothetical protein
LNPNIPFRFIFSMLLLLSGSVGFAQYRVKGTVLDSSRNYRIESVSVLATNGKGTITDTLGRYQIEVGEKDSIWFSYLGKPTPKYAVLKIADVNQFDIALRLKSDVLREVRIKSRSYRQDSIQNRKDYAKIFDYKKVTFGSLTSVGPTGAGIDIDELIRMFQFRKNRNMLKFQERLLQQEEDKFVEHRFSKVLVRRLTNLPDKEMEVFMQRYRPTYEFAVLASEYDFQLYIKRAYEEYKGATKAF